MTFHANNKHTEIKSRSTTRNNEEYFMIINLNFLERQQS